MEYTRLSGYMQFKKVERVERRESRWGPHALLEGYRDLKSHPLDTRTAEVVCSRIKGTEMMAAAHYLF